MKKKGLAMVLALVLLAVCAVSGTLAWLTAKSDTVVNTFTTSDIKVELKETQEPYKMIPGYTIHKDPTVTVLANSEECFLFVKLDESANFEDFLTYKMADGWTKLEGEGITDTVYYRTVEGDQIGRPYSVLENDQVTVKGTVTKADMEALNAQGAAKPTLTITAYASQLYKNATDKFSALEAWNNIASK